jgi:hypothetical protein
VPVAGLDDGGQGVHLRGGSVAARVAQVHHRLFFRKRIERGSRGLAFEGGICDEPVEQ